MIEAAVVTVLLLVLALVGWARLAWWRACRPRFNARPFFGSDIDHDPQGRGQ